MNSVRVLLFATLKDRAGFRELQLSLPEKTDVRGLKDLLGREYPQLELSLRSVLISINREYAADGDIIPDHSEIALFPPVSGG